MKNVWHCLCANKPTLLVWDGYEVIRLSSADSHAGQGLCSLCVWFNLSEKLIAEVLMQ
jgi:hypothetical protein